MPCKENNENNTNELQSSETEQTPIDTSMTDQPAPVAENESAVPCPASNRKGRTFASELLDYTEILVFAIGFVILLFSFVFRICTVDGDSMNNTLFKDESLVVTNLFYEPQREDVIVFHQTGTLNKPVVKRVIAVAGEKVHLRYTDDSMMVIIEDADGKQRVLEESYILYEGAPLYRMPTTFTVPEGSVFVMGDNRNNSKDSRSADIGMVDTRRILGKVVLRISPLSRFGTVS